MSEYNLRNKSTSSGSDEDTILQKALDRVLTSAEFIEILCKKISEKVSLKLREDLNSAKSEISIIKKQLDEANRKIELLEQHSRKDNLRIYGLNENRSECTDEEVVKMCREKLKVELLPSDICVAHRLKAKEDGIRPIIVRFTNRKAKKKVFANKSKLRGSKIIIREDLTPRKLSILREANKTLGFRAVWTNEGSIYTKSGNRIIEIKSSEDVLALRPGGAVQVS